MEALRLAGMPTRFLVDLGYWLGMWEAPSHDHEADAEMLRTAIHREMELRSDNRKDKEHGS